jgi:hypothetical protein
MQRIKATFSMTLCLLVTMCAGGQCPSVKEYTIPQQQAIVKDWNALPDDSALQSPLNDWERMRRELK